MAQSRDMCEDVSEAIAEVYRGTYDLAATEVSTYITDDILICVLEELPGGAGSVPPPSADLLDERRRFQDTHRVEFCDAVERLTGRHVRTFLSANHVAEGIAAEVFFLEPLP